MSSKFFLLTRTCLIGVFSLNEKRRGGIENRRVSQLFGEKCTDDKGLEKALNMSSDYNYDDYEDLDEF